MASCTASAVTILALVLLARTTATSADAPSVATAGEPKYTLSSDGTKMIFANPFRCEKAATRSLTWAIELDEMETLYSFQVAVVDAMDISEEQVTVRVGNNDPLEYGSSSNSICSVANLTSGSSMEIFECEEAVSGTYITVTRNDGGMMNICAFSGNLGTVSLPPVEALSPELIIPASELGTEQSPAQRDAENLIPKEPTDTYTGTPNMAPPFPFLTEQMAKEFAALEDSPDQGPTPAPAPGIGLAPSLLVMQLDTLPKMGGSADVPVEAPVPSPADQIAETATLKDKMVAKTPAPAPGPQAAQGPSPFSLPRVAFTATEPQPTPVTNQPSVTGQTGAGSSSVHSSSAHSNSLSGGAIAGIVIGCLVGVALVAGVVALALKRTSRKRPASLSSRVNPTYESGV